MEPWHEYTLTLDGTAIVAEIRWYANADPATAPFQTDHFRFELTDSTVSAAAVFQRFRDRRAEIVEAMRMYQLIMQAFGSNQNTRRQI
jgi:hypothetical protein